MDQETGRYFNLFNNVLAVNHSGRGGWTLLGVAAKQGELEVVQWLIENQNADIHLAADWGVNPLMVASGAGNIAVMEYLISKGADINRATTMSPDDSATGKTYLGTTPLFPAIRYGQVAAVMLLLKKGANTQTPGPWYKTPIERCYQLLEIVSDLEIGLEHPNAHILGYKPHRNKAQIPTSTNLKKILELLGCHYKLYPYMSCITSKPLLEQSNLFQYEMANKFIILLMATHKTILHMDKTSCSTPANVSLNIMTFLYGTLLMSSGVAEHAYELLNEYDIKDPKAYNSLLNKHLFFTKILDDELITPGCSLITRDARK